MDNYDITDLIQGYSDNIFWERNSYMKNDNNKNLVKSKNNQKIRSNNI